MKPDISFVIPAFNDQDYLALALGSCVAQTHKSIEIIVVDDGSTDATGRIADFYKKDERVKVFHLEKNVGRGAARNIGNFEASSPFIAVLDSDDEATADRSKITLEMLRKQDCMVYGSCVVLDCLSISQGTWISSPFNLEKSVETGLNYIVHSTLAYPKSWWEKNPYDAGYYSSLGLDDWLFEIKAAKAGFPLVHTEKVLCGYRQTLKGISRNRDESKVKELKDLILKDMRPVSYGKKDEKEAVVA